jgi:hypothetical protein
MAGKRSKSVDESSLPLAEAEGAVAERRAKLLAALVAINCDLHMATLCRLIFDSTAGGVSEVQLTCDELARRPDGLCCAQSTCRAAIARVKLTGIIAVRPTATRDGFRGANLYRFNWSRIDQWRMPNDDLRVPESGVRMPNDDLRVPESGVRSGGGEEEGEDFLGLDITQQENPPPPPSAAKSAGIRHTGLREQQPNSADSIAVLQAPAASTRPAPAAGQTSRLDCAATWSQAERHLRLTGLRATYAAASEARQRGLSPTDLQGIADHYLATRAWDGPGAIFHAIRAWLPGDVASDERLWPTSNNTKTGKWRI